MSGLNYGIVLPNWEVEGETERLVEYGVAAEEAGWDGVLLADHLVMGGEEDGYPGFPDPWITHSAIAARTDEIQLVSWVTPIPRRQPWQLARDLASLDRLSDGRVVLGTGLGRAFDYTTFGTSWEPAVLGAKYDEALTIIDRALDGRAIQLRRRPLQHHRRRREADAYPGAPDPDRRRGRLAQQAAVPQGG